MGTPAPTNLPKDWAAPSRSRPILPQRRASFPSYGETVASSYLSRCLLKAKYDRRKLAGSLNAVASTSTVGSGSCPSSEQAMSGIDSSQSKKTSAADYLKKVKNSLEASQYTAFSKTTRTYKTEKNYDVLVASLKNIFLQGSLHMPQLFRDFRQFVSREHIFQFDQECQQLSIS